MVNYEIKPACCGEFVNGHDFDKPKKCPLYVARMDLAHEEALGIELMHLATELRDLCRASDDRFARLRVRADGAENRIKYLENLITECHGRAGIRAPAPPSPDEKPEQEK